MNDPVYCPDCDGNGYINGGECSNCGTQCDMCGDDCATCNGSGYVPNPDLPDLPTSTSKTGTGPDDPTLFTPTTTPEDPNNEETIK